MAAKKLDESFLREVAAVHARNGRSRKATAAHFGKSQGTVGYWIEMAEALGKKASPPAFTVPALPDGELDIDDILAHRRKVSSRKLAATEARKLIPVTVKTKGPIGICFFGDLHIDDDGCDWTKLEEDMRAVNETDGMFAISVGDLQNSWISRLARKWADQSITGKQAWKLVEWWCGEMRPKLLAIVQGNHDAWAKGVNGISPLDWIMAYQPGISESDGVRIELRLPKGDPIIINARHDFAGRSQFNPAHGPLKAAMFGFRDDDVLIAGHTHVSGYSPIKNPATGKVTHPIRTASYKKVDDYASERGFLDGNISESVVVLIDPDEPDPRHRVWVEFSVTRAARILKLMRGK